MSTDTPFYGSEVRTLVDELLHEQRELSAVAKFARASPSTSNRAPGQRHRDLIPLTAPRPGEQYGFEVDLDRCSGCKGCVTACHTLNGLDEAESWREVGVLLGEIQIPASLDPNAGNRVIPWQQTVTTACHHCVEPACLLGCPVLAYDKDPVTGIVRHLDDQCIGCSYCILKCPYEVPRFSAKRGIVRKCDMCQGRLAVGEAPACVQACPNEAIRITHVRSDWATIEWREKRPATWLPDAPAPEYTVPTTRYLTKTQRPYLAAGDHYRNRPAHAHWPLILLLTLTQIGMGAMLAGWWRTGLPTTAWNLSRANLVGLVGFGLFLAGLGASVFHLGQPRKAWRVWLGWRTSWMSREAIALNLLLGVAATTAAVSTVPVAWLGLLGRADATVPLLPFQIALCGLLTIAVAVGVVTQIMVYVDTRRSYWSWSQTGPRFLGTVLLGAALAGNWIQPSPVIAIGLGLILLLKLAQETRALKPAQSDESRRTQARRSAELILGPLRPLWCFRLLAAAFGLAAVLFGHSAGLAPLTGGTLAGVTLITGELAERWLFFAAVSPDKMPGLP